MIEAAASGSKAAIAGQEDRAMTRRTWVRWCATALSGLGLIVAAGGALSPATGKVLEPMVVGWERIFKIDWQATDSKGRPVVHGYLLNDSPYIVTKIQLLVEGLDDSDRIVGQRVAWVPGDLTPFTRVYFSTPAEPAPKYRVRVFAYDRIEAPSRNP
jgi:hypothetical protein